MEQPLQWPYCSYLGRCLHCHDTRWKTGEEGRGGEGRGGEGRGGEGRGGEGRGGEGRGVDSVAMM